MKTVVDTPVFDCLATIKLFNRLRGEDLHKLVPFMEVWEFDAGETLFSEGDGGDYACFIIAGELDVLKGTTDGSRQLATLREGRAIGEMSLLDGSPRSASVIARTGGRCLVLSRRHFDALLDAHPRLGVTLLRRMARLLSLTLRRTSSGLAELLD